MKVIVKLASRMTPKLMIKLAKALKIRKNFNKFSKLANDYISNADPEDIRMFIHVLTKLSESDFELIKSSLLESENSDALLEFRKSSYNIFDIEIGDNLQDEFDDFLIETFKLSE